MNWWFLIFVALQILGLGMALGKHGEQIKGTYNFWAVAINTVLYIWIVAMAVKHGL